MMGETIMNVDKQITKDEITQKVVELLKNVPKGTLPSEVCADALNRICPSTVICQILISPRIENKTVYGI